MTSTTRFALLLAIFATTWVIVAKPLTAQADEPTKPNVLLICIDDLRPELNCFGKDYIHSPNIGLPPALCTGSNLRCFAIRVADRSLWLRSKQGFIWSRKKSEGR